MSDDTNVPIDPDMTPDEGGDAEHSPDLEGDSLIEGQKSPGEQVLEGDTTEERE